jgi:sugar fermentation stimulation protein A
MEARLVDRPNRFLARIRLGRRVRRAHVHDPGRLEELLYPGARVWVRRVPPGRKTAFDVVLARQGRAWVSVYSSLPNRLVKTALQRGRLPELPYHGRLRAEVKHADSRIDFLLPTKPETWLEVKSVSLVKDRVALFPDAPTARGRRHLEHLGRLRRGGARASLMFVVQRPDADVVRPHADRDPDFAAALRRAAEGGVALLARTCRVSPRGIELARAIPVEPT